MKVPRSKNDCSKANWFYKGKPAEHTAVEVDTESSRVTGMYLIVDGNEILCRFDKDGICEDVTFETVSLQ